MNSTAVHVFAGIGAWFCASWLVAFGFGLARRRARSKRTVELFAAMCEAMDRDEAMGRHPAGRRGPIDSPPWIAHVLCCGSRVYGDSVDQLTANLRYHASQCPGCTREDVA